MPPKKKKMPPKKNIAKKPPIYRPNNHKTVKHYSEPSRTGQTYVVTAIVGKWEMGIPLYEVNWEGYEDTTFEPVENLSEATEAVAQYERERTRASEEAKRRRKEAAEARKAEEAERAAALTNANLALLAAPPALGAAQAPPPADGDVSDTPPEEERVLRSDNRLVLRMHKNKTSLVFQHFDLLKRSPTCMLCDADGNVCGADFQSKVGQGGKHAERFRLPAL